MIQTLINILCFVLMLSLIISLHEFGHFLIAKLNRVYVYEYSIGMGPVLFQKKGKETVYSVRLFPIGGYCAMAGEDDNANIQEVYKTKEPLAEDRTLNRLPWYRQIAIMLAGPVMNFVLAWLIFIVLYASLGYRIEPEKPIVGSVSEGTPAYIAGMAAGDEIIRLSYEDGSFIEPKTFTAMVEENLYHAGESIVYTVKRGNEILDFHLTPKYDEESKRYLIGITALPAEVTEIRGWDVVDAANGYFAESSGMIFRVLKKLVRGKGLENLSGPIGIYNVTAEEIQYGFLNYLTLIGVISLNIGIMNLLPIPVFDGGRILLALVEAVLRKPLSERLKNAVMSASVILILLLMVFVTFNDITRLFH